MSKWDLRFLEMAEAMAIYSEVLLPVVVLGDL